MSFFIIVPKSCPKFWPHLKENVLPRPFKNSPIWSPCQSSITKLYFVLLNYLIKELRWLYRCISLLVKPENTQHSGNYRWPPVWLVWIWPNKRNRCSFNKSKGAESIQKVSHRMILPRRLVLSGIVSSSSDRNIENFIIATSTQTQLTVKVIKYQFFLKTDRALNTRVTLSVTERL